LFMEIAMSYDVTHTRPFNAEHAKAGAPVCTRGGAAAQILANLGGGANGYPVVGVYVLNGRVSTAEWTKDGHFHKRGKISNVDLFMSPLGFVDGRPVFVGDMLCNADGVMHEVEADDRYFDGMRWPQPAATEEPAKAVYPEFVGDISILETAYSYVPDNNPHWGVVLRRVANAAIRHAIDSQQVVVVGSGWLSPSQAAAMRDESDAYYRQGKSLKVANDQLHEQVRVLEQKIAVAELRHDELAEDLTGQLDASRGEAARLRKNALHWERIANETDESLCKTKGELASALKELTDAEMLITNCKKACEGMEASNLRACRTLVRHGFTDNGGEEWKPPIGYMPGQKQEMEREIARLTDSLVNANSDAENWKSKYEAVDHANTMLSHDLGHANTQISAWRDNYNYLVDSLQWVHTNTKVRQYSLVGDQLGEALRKTVQVLTEEADAWVQP
jgi:chromosome segregation ATPase